MTKKLITFDWLILTLIFYGLCARIFSIPRRVRSNIDKLKIIADSWSKNKSNLQSSVKSEPNWIAIFWLVKHKTKHNSPIVKNLKALISAWKLDVLSYSPHDYVAGNGSQRVQIKFVIE